MVVISMQYLLNSLWLVGNIRIGKLCIIGVYHAFSPLHYVANIYFDLIVE